MGENINYRRIGITQTIAYTGSSVAAANAFASQTYLVRLCSNSACNFKIGDGVQTAAQDATSPFLPANWESFFTVSPGQRISAIRSAADGLVAATSGTLWVTEFGS